MITVILMKCRYYLHYLAILFPIAMGVTLLSAHSSKKSETWEIDNLQEIGGHSVTVYGNPQVVDTEIGKAIQFDGDGDMLIVDGNPIGEAKEFTVEVVIKPDASFPNNIAPRFIHIENRRKGVGRRLMVELRVNEKNMCYMDAFLQTDIEKLALIDETLVHPTNEWLHVAVSYKDNVLTTYFNGQKELTGQISYKEIIMNSGGEVGIGGRMNKKYWFSGLIKTLKVTHSALEPKDFINN